MLGNGKGRRRAVEGRDMSAVAVHARLLRSYFESARGLIDSEWYCGGEGHECFFQTERAYRFSHGTTRISSGPSRSRRERDTISTHCEHH